jgi:hypothetical protein
MRREEKELRYPPLLGVFQYVRRKIQKTKSMNRRAVP